MLNSLLLWAAKMTLGKRLLQGMAWLHQKANGNKSELLLAGFAFTHLLKVSGVLDEETAKQAEALFGGALPLALSDRANKLVSTLDQVLPKPLESKDTTPGT